MRVFRDLNNLPEFKNSVITIGSFDGVHSGHAVILEELKKLAQNVDGEVVVITFHPHPRQVIYPNDNSLQLLNTIEEKTQIFERYGIDNLVIVPFSVEFSQQSADEYVEKFLVQKFKPRYVVIGYDHKFGLNRQGDIHFLRHHSKQFGFEVKEIQKQTLSDIAISSTRIRKALLNKEIKTANAALNYPYLLTGKVVRGLKIGRTLGYPTANLKIENRHKLIPPNGIYAAYVTFDESRHQAMFYIGNRPSIEGEAELTLEAHIFDFQEDIYGKIIQVELIEFIRDDEKFEGMEALKASLGRDREKVLRVLNGSTPSAPSLGGPSQAFGKSSVVSNDPIFHSPESKTKAPDRVPPSGGGGGTAIVILNFNGRKVLEQFLPSVLKTTYENAKIIVADNGSTDESLTYLKSEFNEVEVIQMPENQGFAGGYNEALETLNGQYKYYVLLNSDVEVTVDWLEPIMELMEADDSIAACQPKILAFRRKTHFEHAGAAGGWMDALGYPFCRGRIMEEVEKDEGQYDDVAEIFWASGAAMVVRAEVYHQLGGLDSSYFAHMEEIDQCWRMKNAGHKIMVCPQSVVYHLGGATLDYDNPRKVFLNFRNSLFTIFKNEPFGKLLWLIPLRLILDGAAGGMFLLKGKFKNIWAIIRAHFAFYGALPRLFSERKKVKAWQVTDNQRNREGIYGGSVVVDYYLRGRKKFEEIIKSELSIEKNH